MVISNFINNFGFGGNNASESGSYDVVIDDGMAIGMRYRGMCGSKSTLSRAELGTAYEKISCIGTSIDLISNNMQMIEPVFWNDKTRKAEILLSDAKLVLLKRLFEKPNSTDNRKTLISKSVKNYVSFGVVYYAIVFDSKKQIVSIKILEDANITPSVDIANNRIGNYRVLNSAVYDGVYTFDGRYYTHDGDSNIVLAPYVNSSPDHQYLPSPLIAGAGLESLMYWYGCTHNKSLLENGARPSLVFMIKQTLKEKFKRSLEESIRVRHSGSGNAGRPIIFDGAADKDVKQLSQNNKDMEFSTMLDSAESAIYKRLGTNWVLGKNINSKDFLTGMEMLFDMTICPMFQGLFNHLFDVYKSTNGSYNHLRIFYLEQDIPALRPRFLKMLEGMTNLSIFTTKERRAMYYYEPLGDERDDELVVQTVKVTQNGNNGTSDTGYTSN